MQTPKNSNVPRKNTDNTNTNHNAISTTNAKKAMPPKDCVRMVWYLTRQSDWRTNAINRSTLTVRTELNYVSFYYSTLVAPMILPNLYMHFYRTATKQSAVPAEKWIFRPSRWVHLQCVLQLHWWRSHWNQMYVRFTFRWIFGYMRLARYGKAWRLRRQWQQEYVPWWKWCVSLCNTDCYFLDFCTEILTDGFECPKEPIKESDKNGQIIAHAMYAHPTDCQKFYVCLNGIEARALGCSAGQVYNEETKRCDAPENVAGWYVFMQKKGGKMCKWMT